MTKNRTFWLIFVVSLISTMVLAGCAPAEEMPAEPMPTEEEMQETAEPNSGEEEMGAEIEVVMQNNTFQPAEVTVSAGSTVIWTNDDALAHTVTSGPRGSATDLFDENVRADGAFRFTFEEPGTYPYHCTIHPGMDGTVIVE